MKTLIKYILMIFPVLLFSQKNTDTLKLPRDINDFKLEVVKKGKSVDSIKDLKNKEIEKQLKILALIKSRVEKIKNEKSIKYLDRDFIVKVVDTIEAIKPSHEPEYWEITPRKWTGRLFHREDFRIRKYKYVDNEKVYLD